MRDVSLNSKQFYAHHTIHRLRRSSCSQRSCEQAKKTLGEVVLELARQSMRPLPTSAKSRGGVPLIPVTANAGSVWLEVVNALRDESC